MKVYQKSQNRKAFDEATRYLLIASRRSSTSLANDHDLMQLVYQCAILRTCAELEQFIKLSIEGWVHHLKNNHLTATLPLEVRAFLATQRLEGKFKKFVYNSDESEIIKALGQDSVAIVSLFGGQNFSNLITSSQVSKNSTYPTLKNLKKLCRRIGIINIQSLLDRNLGRDVELLIESLQSPRTAIAHSQPPYLTIADIKERINDTQILVAKLDRIFWSHFRKFAGMTWW